MRTDWFTCPANKPAGAQTGLVDTIDSLASKLKWSQNTSIKTYDLADQFACQEVRIKKIVPKLAPISKVFNALNHQKLLNIIGQILPSHKNEGALIYK